LCDDMVATAGTLTTAAEAVRAAGAPLVLACATHAVLSGPAVRRVEESGLDELVVTGTHSLRSAPRRASCRRSRCSRSRRSSRKRSDGRTRKPRSVHSSSEGPSMDTVEITIHPRSETGKGAARRMRRAGQVPGILYGPKRTPALISVDTLQVERRLAHLEGSHLIRLVNPDRTAPDLHERMVLVREMQRHPVTGVVLHADFYEVDLTERLVVSVPLHFVGKAAGVVAGGILQPILREIEVECLPTEIPEFIEVDVSPLGIHEAVHVSALTLPAGVTPVGDPTRTVVTVVPPTIEEAKPAEAAEAAPAEGAPAGGAAAAAPAAEGAPAEAGGGERAKP